MAAHRAPPLRRTDPPAAPAPSTATDRRETMEAEFDALAAKIQRETAFPCESYKPQVLRRRIAVRMRACHVGSYPEYAQVLDTDRREYACLLDALTVNVTRFFRDPPTYEALARSIVPALWSASTDGIAAWSAGAASGEEAYSLAAVFHDEALRRHELHRLGRVRIVGTDIDRASLLTAARAEYPPSAFSDAPPEVLDRLFPRTGETRTHDMRLVGSRLRAIVTFQRRDLLCEPAPARRFDLIVCRNVIIYLQRTAQETLLATLHAALRPGGYLVLGRAEMLLGGARARFAPIVPRERIFQRVEHASHPGGAAHG